MVPKKSIKMQTQEKGIYEKNKKVLAKFQCSNAN
jgi:hypothetical protein